MSEVYVREYKCPACGADLHYDGHSDSMSCASCGNTFPVESVMAYSSALEGMKDSEIEDWAYSQTNPELQGMKAYSCPSCGGEIVCEETTAATECPYCGNAAVIPKEVSGVYAPDGIIPFSKTKKDAVEALKKFYKGKTLLPKRFLSENRVQNIQGVYVPFFHSVSVAVAIPVAFETWYAVTLCSANNSANRSYTFSPPFIYTC